MPDAVVIANPQAGGGADLERLRELVDAWTGTELRLTEGPGDASRIAREAAAQGVSRVIAAGGDGTVHEVVGGLVVAGAADAADAGGEPGASAGPALGIVPLGTGNDLARSLELPAEVDDALEVCRTGTRRAIDLIRVEVEGAEATHLINAAAGGFSGSLHDALDAEVKRRWGPLSYLRSAVEAMGENEPWAVRVSVDGRDDRFDALNVVVANGRFAGGGIPIAPHADPFDGVLDLAVVRAAPVLRLSRMAPKLLRGEDPGDEFFVTARGREVVFEAERAMPFSLDGERVDLKAARFRLLPGALAVVVPDP